jgi:hypothetical protein
MMPEGFSVIKQSLVIKLGRRRNAVAGGFHPTLSVAPFTMGRPIAKQMPGMFVAPLGLLGTRSYG